MFRTCVIHPKVTVVDCTDIKIQGITDLTNPTSFLLSAAELVVIPNGDGRSAVCTGRYHH